MQLKEDSLGMMIDQVRMLLIKKKNSRLLEYAFHKVASFVNVLVFGQKRPKDDVRICSRYKRNLPRSLDCKTMHFTFGLTPLENIVNLVT